MNPTSPLLLMMWYSALNTSQLRKKLSCLFKCGFEIDNYYTQFDVKKSFIKTIKMK